VLFCGSTSTGIEAYVRGSWLFRCATDPELAHFQATDKVPKGFGTLVTEIEATLGNGAAALWRMKTLHWDALCSFDHTGFRQITRRYAEGQLKPNYTDEDLEKSWRFATTSGLLAAAELVELSKNQEAEGAVLARMKEYVAFTKTKTT